MPPVNNKCTQASSYTKASRRKAFTLIEMVMVILLLSIVSLGVTSFIGWGTLIFIDGSDRQRMLEESRFIIERLSRELRNAVPFSVRILADGSCVEFVPILASGGYTSVPTTSAATSVTVTDDPNYGHNGGDDFIIRPTSTADVYSLGTNRVNSINPYNVIAGGAIQEATLTITSTQFAAELAASPNNPNRYYMADNQVSYCADLTSDTIRRIEYTDLLANQPADPAGLGGGVIRNDLMAERLVNANPDTFGVFSFADADNTVVQLYFKFARDNGQEPMEFIHLVKVRNAS